MAYNLTPITSADHWLVDAVTGRIVGMSRQSSASPMIPPNTTYDSSGNITGLTGDNGRAIPGTLFLINGDMYMAVNAYWDGSHWQRTDTSKVAWLWQYNVTNNMLNEGYHATTFWTAQPGANPIGDYTAVGGWLMAHSVSEFKDITIGGNGFEIDGNGVSPYGRVRHASISGTKVTELVSNTFLDDSGRDDNTSASWAVGMYGDGFRVRRAPAGGLTWANMMQVLSNGCALIARDADYNSTALQVGGSISCIALGGGIRILEGANAKQGTDTLSGGTKVVSNTSVTANSRIFLTTQSTSGTPGAIYVSARNPGTSFTVTSTSGTDASTFAYQIFEPA